MAMFDWMKPTVKGRALNARPARHKTRMTDKNGVAQRATSPRRRRKRRNPMITIDEAEIMLEDIADELPPEFFNKLNGGILLLPDVKMHPARKADDLYILGEYHRNIEMGRYIVIYFGSFERVHGHLPPDKFREELKKTLVHEFTHHIESLAGERGLEIKDAQNMAKYRRRYEE